MDDGRIRAAPPAPDLGSARVRGSRSLRRALTVRILIVGLVAITASIGLLGAQIQHTARTQARTEVADQAHRTAANISTLFGDWRDELLVASSDAALTDWFEHPDRRATLHGQIDAELVRLHSTYPTLIDEACYISFEGPELARQVKGTPATIADLSPDESGNPFFKPTLAVTAGTVWQNVPYISPDSKRWVVSNSTPIEVGGRKVALLHFEANLDAVRTRVAAQLAPGMRARIIDIRTRQVIADTSGQTPIVADPLAHAGSWRGAAGPVRAAAPVKVDDGRNGNRWRVEVSAPQPQPFTTGLLLRAAGLTLLALLAIAVVALSFAASIARPVLEVTEVAEALARGDLSRQSTVRRGDEIGRVATAVNAAVVGMQEQQTALQSAHEAGQHQLKASHQQQQISDHQVRLRAQAIIDETSAAVLAELDDVVQRVEEVRNGTSLIDERAAVTGNATRDLVAQAGAADDVVTALGDSLRRVGGIADLISSVASQTNLLALNATIESARAGSAGAAFSVVAREVKELASTTAHSTGEITSTIGALEGEVSAVASALAEMAGNVAGIDQATAGVTGVTRQQQLIVDQLRDRVAHAVAQIQAMADITEGLERRVGGERIVLTETGALTHGTERHEVSVLDLSRAGVHCTAASVTGLDSGDTVGVELTLGGDLLQIPATVVRVEPRNAGQDLGLRLKGLPSEAGTRIEAYLTGLLGRPTD